MNRLIIAGSPRVDGRTGQLANVLFEACIEECPEDELAWVPVSEVDVAGCQGCGYCQAWADHLLGLDDDAEPVADDDASGDEAMAPADETDAESEEFARCSIDDDMQDVYELIDAAEELTIVSPVYFAGPPAQLKALLDRLQPYYCLNIADGAGAGQPKRPAILHVVGEGGDPHGFDALITIVQSALAVAGFRLERVYDWVGKIDEDGDIQEEARVIDLIAQAKTEKSSALPATATEAARADDDSWDDLADAEPARPRLHLGDDQVLERGRASSEQGKRPGKNGKTAKRSGKGGTQTNNRNKRKDSQNRRPSDGKNTGPKSQGGRRQGGKSAGSKTSGKGGNRRG